MVVAQQAGDTGVDGAELLQQRGGPVRHVAHPAAPEGRAPRNSAAASPTATAVAAVPRRGATGSTDRSTTRNCSSPCTRSSGSTTACGPIAAVPHRCWAVVRCAAIQPSSARSEPENLPSGLDPRADSGAEQVGGDPDGVPQTTAVVLGPQVAVGDAGRSVGCGQREGSAAVGVHQLAHEVQGTVGDERAREEQHLAVARRVCTRIEVERGLGGPGVRVRGRVGRGEGQEDGGVVGETAADAGQVVPDLDAGGTQVVGRSDPGPQEQVRGADGSGREHDLARVDRGAVGEPDADGPGRRRARHAPPGCRRGP